MLLVLLGYVIIFLCRIYYL